MHMHRAWDAPALLPPSLRGGTGCHSKSTNTLMIVTEQFCAKTRVWGKGCHPWSFLFKLRVLRALHRPPDDTCI